MKAAKQFGWSKTELIANIAANVHENIALASEEDVCCLAVKEKKKSGMKQKVLRMIERKSNASCKVFCVVFGCKEMWKYVIRCRGGPLGYCDREHKELIRKTNYHYFCMSDFRLASWKRGHIYY